MLLLFVTFWHGGMHFSLEFNLIASVIEAADIMSVNIALKKILYLVVFAPAAYLLAKAVSLDDSYRTKALIVIVVASFLLELSQIGFSGGAFGLLNALICLAGFACFYIIAQKLFAAR